MVGQHIRDTNHSDVWTYNDEMPSQTQTNRSNLAMTTTSMPMQQQPCHSRDEIETSIRDFSRLWPSMTETVHSDSSNRFNDSQNSTISTQNQNNELSGNYLKRNGALVSGGVPLPPLTLETEPIAWDLPSSAIEINQNRKLKPLSFKGKQSISCVNRCTSTTVNQLCYHATFT